MSGLLLACVAAIPRVVRPDISEFKLDEATVVLNARAIVQDHVFPLHGQASSVPGLYHSPILFYLVAPFLAIQSDPRAAIVGIGLINALSVGLTYVVVARSFNRRVALASTLLFASGSWALIFSRKIWSIDLLAPCAVIALWGLLRAIDPTNRTPGLGRSWVALAVMVALNYSSWPLVVVVGLVQVCLPRTRRGTALVWSALGASVLLAPLLLLAPNLIGAFAHPGGPLSHSFYFDLQPLDFVVQLASPTGFLVLAGPAPTFAREVAPLTWLEPAMRALLFGGGALAILRCLAPLTRRATIGTLPRSRDRGLRLTPEAILLLWWLTPAVLSLARFTPVYIHHFADTFPAQFILMGLAADGLARALETGMSRLRLPAGAKAAAGAVAGPAVAAGAAAIQLTAFSLYLPYVQAHPLDTYFGVPLSYDLRAARMAGATTPSAPVIALGSSGDTVGVDESPTVLASVASAGAFQFADSDKSLVFPTSGQATYLLRRQPDDGLDDVLAPWRNGDGPLSATSVDVGADYQVAQGDGIGNWLPPDWKRLEIPLEDDSLVVGYTAPRQLEPGKPTEVDVAWRVGQPPADPRQQSVFAHVVDDAGHSSTGQDLAPMPSSDWISGETMVNRFAITPPKDLPPGRYWIEFGRYQRPEVQPVRVVSDGKPGPSSVKIGPLAVAPKRRDLPGATPANASFGNQITLAGWKASPSGSSLNVTLLWRADKPPTGTYTVFVHLVGAGGTIVSQNDSEPRRGKFPTSTWNPGDQIPDRHVVPLQGVKPGAYSLQIGLYTANGTRLKVGSGDSLTVGPVVVAPRPTPGPTTASPARPPTTTKPPVKATPVPPHGTHGPTPSPRRPSTSPARATPTR